MDRHDQKRIGLKGFEADRESAIAAVDDPTSAMAPSSTAATSSARACPQPANPSS